MADETPIQEIPEGRVVLWRAREKGAPDDQWGPWTDLEFETYEYYDLTMVEIQEQEFAPVESQPQDPEGWRKRPPLAVQVIADGVVCDSCGELIPPGENCLAGGGVRKHFTCPVGEPT